MRVALIVTKAKGKIIGDKITQARDNINCDSFDSITEFVDVSLKRNIKYDRAIILHNLVSAIETRTLKEYFDTRPEPLDIVYLGKKGVCDELAKEFLIVFNSPCVGAMLQPDMTPRTVLATVTESVTTINEKWGIQNYLAVEVEQLTTVVEPESKEEPVKEEIPTPIVPPKKKKGILGGIFGSRGTAVAPLEKSTNNEETQYDDDYDDGYDNTQAYDDNYQDDYYEDGEEYGEYSAEDGESTPYDDDFDEGYDDDYDDDYQNNEVNDNYTSQYDKEDYTTENSDSSTHIGYNTSNNEGYNCEMNNYAVEEPVEFDDNWVDGQTDEPVEFEDNWDDESSEEPVEFEDNWDDESNDEPVEFNDNWEDEREEAPVEYEDNWEEDEVSDMGVPAEPIPMKVEQVEEVEEEEELPPLNLGMPAVPITVQPEPTKVEEVVEEEYNFNIGMPSKPIAIATPSVERPPVVEEVEEEDFSNVSLGVPAPAVQLRTEEPTRVVPEVAIEEGLSSIAMAKAEEAYRATNEAPKVIIKEVRVPDNRRQEPQIQQAVSGGDLSTLGGVLKGRIKKTIVVTGDRGSGITTTALTIANSFANNVPVLYFDCDTELHGLLSYIDYDELRKFSEHQLRGVELCKSSRAFNNCVCSYATNLDILTSDYSSEVTDRTLENTQGVVAEVANDYSILVVDCPISKLHLIQDLVLTSVVIVCVEGSKRGFMNTLCCLEGSKLPVRHKRSIASKGTIFVTKLEPKADTKKVLKYVDSIYEADEVDWLKMKIREFNGNLTKVLMNEVIEG